MALTARGFFPLIASHFPPEKLELSIRLFYALLPVVLITGIATNCTAVLNTFDRFALPALAPVAISGSDYHCGALLLSGRFGIWAMVYSTLAGALFHAGGGGVDDGRARLSLSPVVARNDRGHARGGATSMGRCC